MLSYVGTGLLIRGYSLFFFNSIDLNPTFWSIALYFTIILDILNSQILVAALAFLIDSGRCLYNFWDSVLQIIIIIIIIIKLKLLF